MNNRDRIKIEQHSGLGLLWIAGWLFTIGYSELSLWNGVLAMILWPYFLGADLAALDGTTPSAPPSE
jgi:hypothetical protein